MILATHSVLQHEVRDSRVSPWSRYALITDTAAIPTLTKNENDIRPPGFLFYYAGGYFRHHLDRP